MMPQNKTVITTKAKYKKIRRKSKRTSKIGINNVCVQTRINRNN